MKIIVEVNCDAALWKENQLLPINTIKKKSTNAISTSLKYIDRTILRNELFFSILLTSDKKIQKLNSQYRKQDKPTNVLSFPYLEDTEDHGFHVGDMVFAYETLLKEAQEKSWPFDCSEKIFENHFIHLVVHSTLHLFGFHHDHQEEAEIMEKKEILILQELGIENPYESLEE